MLSALLLFAVFIVKNGAEHALCRRHTNGYCHISNFLHRKVTIFLFICSWVLPTAIRKVKQNWKHGLFYNDNDTDNDNDDDNNNCRFNQFKHCH